jgi:hypothetical protein
MPGRVLEAGALFDVALQAARSIVDEPRQGNQTTSLISIVFVVVSLEAFLNESAGVAHDVKENQSEPEIVASFAQLMEDAKWSSLETKFNLAKWLLTGKRADRGRPPYQDLSLLVRIRNALIHFDPNYKWDTFEEMKNLSQKKIINDLRAKNILAERVWGHGSWTSYIQTKAVAEWACHAGSQVVLDFVKDVPIQGQWAFTVRHSSASFEIK